jgi:hypothetical protein
MSWNVLSGIREGEHNARALARAKRRGAKLAGGAGSRSSKHAGARSAGRAAISKMKSRGRGISIQVHLNGSSFKNRLDYANREGKNAELIYSNGDINSMRACARRRPDIKNPVGHVSISLPQKSGRLTKNEWQEILKTVRDEYGLDEAFPMQVWRHNDTSRDHLHIIFSRISVTGKCHDAQNSAYRAAAIERIVEDHHNLPLVPPSEFKTTNSKLTKNEIEQGVRTQQKPARLQIADALKIATQGRPTVQQFVERLNAAEIGVKASVATTGKMNGFSFSYDGIAFSGSKISKEFGWKALSERILYDEINDREFLAQLDGTTGTASHDLADATAIANQLVESIDRISPATHDAGAAAGQPAPAADRAISRVEPATPARPVAPAPVAGRALGRPAPVPARVVASRRAEPVDAVVSSNSPVIITPPDLKVKDWVRSAQLLDEYRRAIKSKANIADLDRLSVELGHDPADIVSVHATVTNKLPSKIAQDVLRNAPSEKMREYIKREFEASKKRFEASKSDVLNDDPGMRPRM